MADSLLGTAGAAPSSAELSDPQAVRAVSMAIVATPVSNRLRSMAFLFLVSNRIRGSLCRTGFGRVRGGSGGQVPPRSDAPLQPTHMRPHPPHTTPHRERRSGG